MEPSGCCVGVAGIAGNGVAVSENGEAFSVSRTTGVKVSVRSSGGVTEPSSGADVVTLPPGPATIIVSSAVAAPLLWVAGNGVGVIVSSPLVAWSVAGVGVALTVSVTTGA